MALGNAMQATRKRNALSGLYAEQGAGIMAGDPSAMNALAGLDPMEAYKLQRQRAADGRAEQQFEMTRESHGASMQLNKARLAQIEREAEMAMAQAAARMSDAERAKEAQETQTALAHGKAAFIQGDQGVAQWTQQYGGQLAEAGISPEAVTVENFPEVLMALKGFGTALSGGQVDVGNMVPEQPGYRPATAAEAGQYGAKAGQFDTKTGRFYPNNPPKDSSIVVGADGSIRITEGAGAGDISKPSSAANMITTIDGILSDPAFDKATGLMSITQSIPGTDAYRFGTRVRQLEGQAFLQAFEGLKGGGQITEIEGAKATQAAGRLDSAQSPEDYRDALNELRDILVLGQSRPQGWAASQRPRATPAPNPSPAAPEGGPPQSFLKLVPQGDNGAELWEWMTPDERAEFQ